MFRGTTLAFGFSYSGKEEDLSTAFFTCRKTHEGPIVFQKSLENHGITKIEDYLYKVRVAPEDTENVNPGKYWYDFKIGITNDKFVILYGSLDIRNDVTH